MVYEEVDIDDMDFDEELGLYTYECPCGDLFQISEEELAEGEEIAYCPSCSLVIRVLYDPEDFELLEDEEEGEEGEAGAAAVAVAAAAAALGGPPVPMTPREPEPEPEPQPEPEPEPQADDAANPWVAKRNSRQKRLQKY